MSQRTQRQVQVQDLIMFALQVKKKRAQIRLRRQRRLKSLTGHEFNSADDVLENGDSSFSDLKSNTSMPMSSDSSSPTTGSLSSTSKSDTNEPSDDSSVYSDPFSLSTVSRLDLSTDSDTESEYAGSNPDSGTEADDELDASAPTAEAQLGELMARNQLPRGPSQMRHVLDILKPRLLTSFTVADWAGLGKGTVHLITRRVMTALYPNAGLRQPTILSSAVKM
ncbi:hypothetical protein BDR07DRAFT_1456258 [Suillus spraguei]|nr:hypothetical protein BDR07DRAFT_1456258 [Suillus spraguei]